MHPKFSQHRKLDVISQQRQLQNLNLDTASVRQTTTVEQPTAPPMFPADAVQPQHGLFTYRLRRAREFHAQAWIAQLCL